MIISFGSAGIFTAPVSTFHRCVSHNESFKELGPYAVYSSNEDADPQLNTIDRDDLDRIRRIVSDEITNHCLDFRRNDAFNYYSDLLFLDNSIVNFRAYNSTNNTRIFSNIVTLNYDFVIEYIFERPAGILIDSET